MSAPKKQHLARRVQALALHSVGVSFPVIKEKTGYSKSAFYKLRQKAISRGYVDGGPILDEHIADAKRTGRPLKQTPEVTAEVLNIATENSTVRGCIAESIAEAFNKEKPAGDTISRRTVLRILTRSNLNGVKRTPKPGRSKDQERPRDLWCL